MSKADEKQFLFVEKWNKVQCDEKLQLKLCELFTQNSELHIFTDRT